MDSPTLFAATGSTSLLATFAVSSATCSEPVTRLLSSSDGGASFQALHSWVQLSLAAISFATAEEGWAVGAYSGVIIHTTDGGRTWSQQLPSPSPVTAIDFSSANDGWGIGTPADPGSVLRSVNGGVTWRVTASLPGFVEGLSALSHTHAFVVDKPPSGDWSMMATTDGGASWTTVYTLHGPHQATFGIAAFQMLNASDGLMV